MELEIDPGSTPEYINEETSPKLHLDISGLKSSRSEPDGEEIIESFDENAEKAFVDKQVLHSPIHQLESPLIENPSVQKWIDEVQEGSEDHSVKKMFRH